MTNYNNTCISLTAEATPDPYITYSQGAFFLTFTAGDRVEIWKASSLPGLSHQPEKHTIWRPPPDTDHSNDLWAPELHQLQGRWYVYVAAAHPVHGNKSHRMYVLGGPAAHQDPTHGGWEYLGPIQGMDQRQWAIDGTIVHLNHQMYFVYSGWPVGEMQSEKTQEIFIIRLRDPVTADSGATCLCEPREPWERSGDAGINEGPQFLQAQDNSWVGVVYSCAGSWTKDYKMNTLQYIRGDPLNRSSWRKNMQPLISNNNGTSGPWGPGHGSFIHIGNETLGIFHATDRETDGWGNRKARMQRLVFRNGQPFMGNAVGPLTFDFAEFIGGSAGFGTSSTNSHQTHSGLGGLMHKIKDKIRDEL